MESMSKVNFSNTRSITSFPVYSYKDDILKTVANNPVTIISAQTGAGKSTLVPKFLCEAGYNVVVAVHSRISATSLANRVSTLLNSSTGNIVGYHTGYEKKFSPHTQILYTTEGLQFIKELYGTKDSPNRVLIIDDINWNVNVESLVAWIRYKLENGCKSKFILMSATLESQKISEFFWNAPIIDIPGYHFDIKVKELPSNKFVQSIYELATAGHNVLAFVPGKREIEQTILSLEKMRCPSRIFPLHADMMLDEQAKVFDESDTSKVIVSTNVTQFSITIPGIDAVVDSGLERRMLLIDELSLFGVGNISYSDHIQRKGRAGRTCPGVYYWCNDTPINSLDKFPMAEIYTGQINQIVLKLANADVRTQHLTFFHQPEEGKLQHVEKVLRDLNAFDSENKITELGKIMSLFPIDVRCARMLVEAQKRGVLSDVATIVSIMTHGGLKKADKRWNKLDGHYTSDILSELYCFNDFKNHLNSSEHFFKASQRNYFRILELRSKLYDILFELYGDVSSTGSTEDIIKSCATGFIDLLYVKSKSGWYYSPYDEYGRKLELASSTLPSRLVLALPKNIITQVNPLHAQTLYLLAWAISVDKKFLEEIAPQLVENDVVTEYNYQNNSYLQYNVTTFNGIPIDREGEPTSDISVKRDTFVNWLAQNTYTPSQKNLTKYIFSFFKNARNFLSNEGVNTLEELTNWYRKFVTENFNNQLPNMSKEKNIEKVAKMIVATFQTKQ